MSSTYINQIDPGLAPRERDRLVCQWAGPYFRGASNFLYEAIRYNRASFGGTLSAARWKTDSTFFVVPEFGTGSYAITQNNIFTVAPLAITISGWMKPITLPIGGTAIMGTTVSGPAGIRLVFALNTLALFLDGVSTSYTDAGLPALLTDGEWHHFAGTKDAAGAAYLFLDGVQVATSSGNTLTWPAQPVVLAGDNINGVPTPLFNGRLYDVRIYSRELEQDEITNLANPVLSQRLFRVAGTPVIPPTPVPIPPTPLLNQPPYYRTVVKGQTYADETSPIIFEQQYGEPWYTVDDATEIKAILTKGSGQYGVPPVTIEKDVLFATIANPSLWFSLSASETAAMTDGEWSGEIVGYEAGGSIVEVYRKFTLFVRD